MSVLFRGLLPTLLLVACSTEDRISGSNAPVSASALARRAGFDPRGAVIRGANLVVEGDMLISIDTARRVVENGVSLLWVSNAQADTGIYTLDVSAIPTWAGNAEMAGRAWTFGKSTGLRFATSETGPVAGSLGTVSLLPFTSATNPYCPAAIACAQFRNGARLGTFIAINTDAFAAAPYTSMDWRISILTHELGHAMGFRHANWQVTGEPAAFDFGWTSVNSNSFVAGSFDNNTQSVMRSFFTSPRWPDIWDRTAARLVYPGNAGTMYPRASICPIGCDGNSADDYTVETEDAVQDAIENQYSFAVEVTRPGIGVQRYTPPALGMPSAFPAAGGQFVLELSTLGYPTTYVGSCDPSGLPNGVVKLYRISRFPLNGGGTYERESEPACFRVD